MPSRIVVSVKETFGEEIRLQGVDPKMERVNRDDPKSASVQAKDKDGVPKWIVAVTAKTMAFDNARYETVSITVTSATKPLDNVPPGTLVTIEKLEYGVMDREKHGHTEFYSAESIRPLQPPRMPVNPRMASGQ